jgi:M61 glycyl aminopeptidase
MLRFSMGATWRGYSWLATAAGLSVVLLCDQRELSSSPTPTPSPSSAGVAPHKDAGTPDATAADAMLRLTAVCDAGSDQPSALEVALSLPLAGRPVFQLEDDVMGSTGMASLVSMATAVDQKGTLPLVRRVVTGSGGDRVLELAASRDAVGTVTLRYRARSVPVADEGARYGLRHDATGIGGVGTHFLVLPEPHRAHRIRIEWVRPACPTTVSGEGMSSFGDGPVAEMTGTLDSLRAAAYFFGHPRVAMVDDSSVHMRTAWFGEPSLDVGAAASWMTRVFAIERGLFVDDESAGYAAFVRVLPSMGARSNGVSQPSSFLLAIGPNTPWGPRLRTNIAHEMLHRWLGQRLRLAGPEGSSYWFTEGFTCYYASALMRRAGLISPDEFLAELNLTATRQFSNEYATATNDEIRRDFFKNDALSVVPYARGSLYAAELDAAIRRASRGARTLDDAMRELYHMARSAPAGDGLAPAAFRRMVLRELGQGGVERFAAVILRGERPEPPSDAFGPCFAREPRSIAVFQLGFDDKRSLVEPRAIRALVPGSSAARAGLVEGERLVSIESSFLDPETEAIVTVERGGKPVEVRYLPARAGATRAGYRWVRVAGVPDERCSVHE